MTNFGSALLATGGLAFALPAAAQTAAVSADSSLPAICTDRPTKSNFACTVEPDHFQYEADIANFASYNANGVTTQTWIVINPTFKYGLTPQIDIEANFSPFVSARSHDRTGLHATETGVSDLYLRMKYQFVNIDDGAFQATLLPYVKVPAAKPGIGNEAIEGGLLVPVNYKLTDTITLTAVPELDIFKNALDDGRHANTAQLVNVGFALPGNFTLYGELWGDWTFDPTGTVTQLSADAALAYGVTPYLQLDVGLNVGLNRNTPDLQGYIGIAQKF